MVGERAARVLVAAMAIGLLTIVVVLYASPPTFVVRWVALSNADWLLSDYMEPARNRLSIVRNAARKITALYVQYGMAATFRDHHPISNVGDDADRIAGQLVALRRVMLNQSELPHRPGQWSPILSGVGYCDQMNAVAANVLGGEFEHAEIVGLANPVTKDEHTIGRVWSDRRAEWLYFDLWGDVAVFRLRGDGTPEMLASYQCPTTVDSATRATVAGEYAFAAKGVPFNEYPETLGGFLIGRAKRALSRRTLDSFAPIAAARALSVSGPTTSPQTSPSYTPPAIRRAFADAQFALVAGRDQDAAKEFRSIAAGDSLSVLGRASLMLADRVARPR
jgi:hypothetical protein